MEADARLLPLLNPAPIVGCPVCGEEFSAVDIALFRYDVEGMICSGCLEEMAKAPFSRSCFAKCYDEDRLECRSLCPDRHSCQTWEGSQMAQKIEYTAEMRREVTRLFRKKNYDETRKRKIEAAHPFKKGTIMRIIWDRASKGVTVQEIRDLCSEISTRPEIYLRALRKESKSGYEWKCEEGGGRLIVKGLQKTSL